MMRMLLMSLRLGIAHHLRESIEQIAYVVRPRAGLGMSLEAKRRSVRTGETLEGTVEERDVGGLQVGPDGGGIDGKPVVLAGDDDLAGFQVLHRVVGAVVAELHLQGLRARGEAHQLVAEADAE